MKGEKLETRLNSSSQTILQTTARIHIPRNLLNFPTRDRHFSASIKRTMSRIHLRRNNPQIHIAERAACISRQKNHQVDQKPQSHKKTATLGRSTKRQPFPVPLPGHHSASSLPATSDLLFILKKCKIVNHFRFSLGYFSPNI